MERNESYSQAEEKSDPVSEGRIRSDVPIYSPTTHSRHPRTPPTPAPSEDRLSTDWSSIGSRSPPVIPPPQSVPMRGTLITPGIEGIHETEQAAPQPSQPVSQESHIGTMRCAVQEDLPTPPNICQHPLERSNLPDERRMTDIGTNTSDVVIEPTGSGPRPSCMEANAQTSIPIVDILLPSGLGDHITMPLMEEDPLDVLEDKDHWALKDLLGPQGPPGPMRPIIVQTPQVTLDTTALENTFDTVGQSMIQLARAQSQTNRQLQQHIQQGQANMQAHMGALQKLTTST